MTGTLPFFKLHDGFPEHPKTLALSDKAFRHLVELWCYCHRNKTDGMVPKNQIQRATSAKTRRELVDAGFLILGSDRAEMRDYLEHQESRQDIENRANTRAEAGRKGGNAKANNLANARQMPRQPRGKNVADVDVDTDELNPRGFSSPPTPQRTDLAVRDPGKNTPTHRETMNAGTKLVNRFIDSTNVAFPSKVKSDLVAAVTVCVQDGIPAEVIARGLELWNAEGYPASTLPTSVLKAQREANPSATIRPTRRATGTERAISTLALAEEIAETERNERAEIRNR